MPPISSNGQVAGNTLVLPRQSAEVILLLHASYGQGEDHPIIIGARRLFYTEGWLEKAARLEIIQAPKSLYNPKSHSSPPSPLGPDWARPLIGQNVDIFGVSYPRVIIFSLVT